MGSSFIVDMKHQVLQWPLGLVSQLRQQFGGTAGSRTLPHPPVRTLWSGHECALSGAAVQSTTAARVRPVTTA
ncbi:hypothetical protein GCM10009740_20840 [Terrabacter terrae]|uniref:Uncharacterized protein n=1 Tax=Terrabacter terrae TaxID=318434 RepID=A0ABP5FSX7_9MICO